MRAYSVVCVLGAFVCSLASEDAVCTSAECPEPDPTALLQGHIKVGSPDDSQEAMREVLTELKNDLDEEDKEGWPDLNGMFKKVKSVMGGAEELEKDFEGVVAAAKEFLETVSSDVKSLVSNVDPSKGIDGIRSQVQHFYGQVQEAAKKLWEAIKKLGDAWNNGVGKIAPKALTDEMMKILNKVTEEAKLFADSFKHAAEEIQKVDVKAICLKVKHSLHAVLEKASALVKSAEALKHPPKEIEEALKLLPSSIKDEVDKVLKKGEHAADHILAKINKGMVDITHGVANAFDGHCHGLPRSGSTQLGVSAAAVLVLGMFSIAM